MIKNKFKAHPIMMARLIKPYLFIIIIPLIRALVQYAIKHEVDYLLPIEIVLFALVAVMTVFRWLSIRIKVENQRIIIKKGFFIKSRSVIDVSRVSSITVSQNILDFVCGSVSCSINTEAGRVRKSDFDIKLSLSDAKMLYDAVYGDEKMKTLEFSAFRIALLAATTSTAATGIVVGVPILNRTSDLIGIAISDMLLNEINNVSSKFDSIFPPVVNTITIALFLAYCASFLISFIKNINFKLKSGKNSIEVQSGLLTRKKVFFRKNNVNNVCIEQTPLMRMLKKHSMRVSIGGYRDVKGAKAVIVPIASRTELENQLKKHFQSFRKIKCCICPQQTVLNRNRMLLLPLSIGFAIIAAATTAIIIFPYFDRLVLFLGIITMVVNLYFASVYYRNYKKGQICFGERVFVSGSKRLLVRELYCDKNKVGIIRLFQTPADRRFNTCKIKVVVRSETADSVKVINVSTDLAVEQINSTYNLNLHV